MNLQFSSEKIDRDRPDDPQFHVSREPYRALFGNQTGAVRMGRRGRTRVSNTHRL